MFLGLVLSTIFVLVSAANEDKENHAVGEVGKIIMEESQKGAITLAGFWDKNEKTDQQSIDDFLRGLESNVFGKVKNNVVALVKNSLGKAVSQPERTDMYKVLQNIVQKYTTELTLGQATTISTNQQIKENVPRKGGDDKLSKTIASLYNEVANKNITAEDKSNLLGKSQKQIDAFIKMTIKAESNSKSKVASRSGSFFFNHNLQQQQQAKSSSSVAHKLTQQMMNNMCAPQPTYTNNCYMVCPHCSQCVSGHGHGQAIHFAGSSGGHNSYRHSASMDSSLSSRLTESGHSIINSGGSSNGLIGSGYTGLTRNTDTSSGSFIGSGHTGNKIMQSGGFSSGGLIGGEQLGSNGFGNHGSSISFSGNAHNTHSSSLDASISGSLNSHNPGYAGAHGTSLGDVKGSYSGISNLWSLNKAGSNSAISANSYDGSTFDSSSRLGGYDGTSYVGGGTSYNQHPGSLNNIHGHGLGSVGGGGQYKEKISASNRKSSSSKSDSSSNQYTYENSGHLW